MASETTGEFSRPVAVADIPGEGTTLSLEASEAECAVLAQRLDVVGLAGLAATVGLAWDGQEPPTLGVEGRLGATVTRRCVVSLAAFDTVLDESFVERYRRDPDGTDGDAIVEDEAMDSQRPESSGATLVLAAETIDVGELVAQHLALALDPYPRAPGVAFDGFSDPQSEAESPFAELARLLRS